MAAAGQLTTSVTQVMSSLDADTSNDSLLLQHSPQDYQCADTIPTAEQLFANITIGGIIMVSVLCLFTLITVGIYIEEVFFIAKNFLPGSRREKTIWILAFFPVFSVCGLVGYVVPRSGTLVDMISSVYFSLCLYNFGHLMVNYMGGPVRMWQLIGGDRKMPLNTPPCCCCCVCLPAVKFDPHMYFKITMSILQLAIVRPLLMFLAAVMWTNNNYHPGNMSPFNGYVYIAVVNLVSTLVAYYGLTLLRAALRPDLERQFSVTGKIMSLQLTMLCSSIPNIIIGILVATDVIKCSPLLSSKSRGEAINCAFLVLIMLPFALIGRYFYRRKSDGSGCAGDPVRDPVVDKSGGIPELPWSGQMPEKTVEMKPLNAQPPHPEAAHAQSTVGSNNNSAMDADARGDKVGSGSGHTSAQPPSQAGSSVGSGPKRQSPAPRWDV